MNTKESKKKTIKPEEVQIIPLGGLDRIGMNITAIRCRDTIIVIDCGVAFPDEELPGIDKVVPDVTYLTDHLSMVKAFIITHGHEDHIGALPYILPSVNVPIYATKLTMGILEHKLEENGVLEMSERHVVRNGSTVKIGDLKVEFIKTNHSIPGASAIAVHTPAGVIFHTGDFKVDYTPLFGDTINLQRIAELGQAGVLAVLSDSTNAMRPGFTPSETHVAQTFDALFTKYTKNRILVATFASNVDRVQQLLNTAKKFGRKVVIQGRSMDQVLEIADQLGCVKIPKNTLISVEEIGNYPPEKLVCITTGSQGEAMAALSRMADNTHKKISIGPGDVVIFSSKPIPGNEKAINRVMNELAMKGAEIIYQDTHVSGHACQQELQLIYTLLRPQYAIPVHGEFRHRQAAAGLVKNLGTPSENIFLLQSGDVLTLSAEHAAVTEHVTARGIFVEGLTVGDVGNAVIRDRQELSSNGIIMVAVTLDRVDGRILAGPQIVTRGFVYVKESGDLIGELEELTERIIIGGKKRNSFDRNRVRNDIRNGLEQFLWDRFQRSPIIMPVILDV